MHQVVVVEQHELRTHDGHHVVGRMAGKVDARRGRFQAVSCRLAAAVPCATPRRHGRALRGGSRRHRRAARLVLLCDRPRPLGDAAAAFHRRLPARFRRDDGSPRRPRGPARVHRLAACREHPHASLPDQRRHRGRRRARSRRILRARLRRRARGAPPDHGSLRGRARQAWRPLGHPRAPRHHRAAADLARVKPALGLRGIVENERRYAWLIALAVLTGVRAAVGREGPIAQIGGSIGAAVARLARLATEERKVLIACGAGAGIATTFNAPLGGLLFAQEIVLLGEVHLANFSLIVVATTTAVVAARGLLGNQPVFPVTPFELDTYWECFTYGVLGVVIGLLAVGYIRFFHAVAARARRNPWPRPLVLLAGLP